MLLKFTHFFVNFAAACRNSFFCFKVFEIFMRCFRFFSLVQLENLSTIFWRESTEFGRRLRPLQVYKIETFWRGPAVFWKWPDPLGTSLFFANEHTLTLVNCHGTPSLGQHWLRLSEENIAIPPKGNKIYSPPKEHTTVVSKPKANKIPFG